MAPCSSSHPYPRKAKRVGERKNIWWWKWEGEVPFKIGYLRGWLVAAILEAGRLNIFNSFAYSNSDTAALSHVGIPQDSIYVKEQEKEKFFNPQSKLCTLQIYKKLIFYGCVFLILCAWLIVLGCFFGYSTLLLWVSLFQVFKLSIRGKDWGLLGNIANF